MSALHAPRIAERSGAAVAYPALPPRASGWARHGAGEPPAIALVKEHLNSAVVALMLLLAVVGSSRVDLQACKLEYSIVSPK